MPFLGGALGLVDAALCGALAVVIYAVAPERRVNRALALLLLFEGGAQLGAAAANLHVGPPTPILAGWLGIFLASAAFLPAMYLLVVRELDSPLARPLRHPLAAPALVAVSLFLAWQALGTIPRDFTGSDADAIGLGVVAMVLAATYGLAAALSALGAAKKGSTRRAQARAFALAFGVRDVLFLLYFVPDVVPGFPRASVGGVSLPVFATLFFVLLLAYGILHSQLFDIELKVKWTLKHGTVAGAFVAAFFVASEAAQQFFAESIGPYAGIVAAGALVFAISPIQRLADRLSHTAMPNVSTSPEYVAFRKLEVYRAAVESAHESGGIEARERASLARLREKLGVRAEDAMAVERDVLESVTARAA